MTKWVIAAMNGAISKVRLENAVLRLKGTSLFSDDTAKIRNATRLYVETWIVPLLEAVRDGDRHTANNFTRPPEVEE